ncbi:MAG: hypothetical protein ACK5JT_06090, partial [Hyphomicrobiaceae bacterium]
MSITTSRPRQFISRNSIHRLSLVASVFSVFTLLLCQFSIWLTTEAADREISAEQKQYSAYLLADELRQTVDGLARMARA